MDESAVLVVFSRYLSAQRPVVERRAERTNVPLLEFKHAIDLQRVLIDMQALRFGQLLKTGFLNSRTSLNDVALRLDRGWTEADEHALLKNAIYSDLVTKEKAARACINKDHTLETKSSMLVQNDPTYLKARATLADSVQTISREWDGCY